MPHSSSHRSAASRSTAHTASQLAARLDFVDGDKASDALVQNYEKHLAETIQKAAEGLSLRTIRGNKVGNVLVAEIKG
jgi:hypothetical protein